MKKQLHSMISVLLVVATALSGACTKKSSSPGVDTPPQSGACANLNLVRDASWTAGFVKSFVSCLSTGNESSREKFALTLSVLDTLGDQSLGAALDMFQWEYEGKKVFLGMVSSMMDRGITSDEEKRFTETQALLEDTKPYAFINLMIEMKKRDLLNPLLDVLESTDSTLPEGFLETGIRQFLSDQDVRSDAEVLVRAFLADSEAFAAFNSFLTPDRKALAADCSKTSTCPYSGAAELKSSTQHWLDFWAGLAPERREYLALALSEVMKGSLEQENDVALERSKQLLDLGVQSLARSRNIFKEAGNALDLVLESPLNSYKPFIDGLNLIKDNPIYLDAFQEKMGSALVQDSLETLIGKGGQPRACSQPLRGLSEGKDEASRRLILEGLMTPQKICGDKVPVLVALSESLGYECPAATCGRSLLNGKEAIEAQDLQAFLKHVMSHTAKVLKIDPWTLYRWGAAHRDITPALWDEISVLANQRTFSSLSDLVAFEKELANQYRSALSSNWLELVINQELLELSTVEQSFAGLFPDRSPIEQWYFADADAQMARIVFGLYPSGPADQALQQMFKFEDLTRDWYKSHPKSQIIARDLAQILAPLRSLSSQFKSPASSFKPEAEKIVLPWLGGSKNSPSFGRDGKQESAGDALKLSLLFDETESGLNLRSRLKEQLALATASLPKGEAEEFASWMSDVWLPSRIATLETTSLSQAAVPVELFDRKDVSPAEARMLTLFLGTQFAKEMTLAPRDAKPSELPETNVNPKVQAARTLAGAAAMGGNEHPWTSYWLFKNDLMNDSHSSLQGLIDVLPREGDALQSSFASRAVAPVLVSQGLLDVSDGEKLNDHEKLLVQLQLMSPIFENRGKQFFVPSIGFDAYCPQKQGTSWVNANCPFQFKNFEEYRSFLEARLKSSFCAVLPEGNAVTLAMGLKDTAASTKSFCSGVGSETRWSKSWLEANLLQTLRLGKNPRLKSSLQSIPSELRWLKVQSSHSPRLMVREYLNHAPVIDGLTSAKVAQRMGVYQTFFSALPTASSVWMLFLSKDIGLRGISDSLKKLGNAPLADSEAPIQDFLGLITSRYEEALAKNEATLDFGLALIQEINKRPYARETAVRLLNKPYDPYAGVLIGYTLPQAVKAGILPDFSWDQYAPLRFVLQNENLFFLQGVSALYDRELLEWMDIGVRVTEKFPSVRVMAEDLRPVLYWLKAYLKSGENETAHEIVNLAVLRDWTPALEAATRTYRLLRVSLLDLSNRWHDAFYFETPALARTLLESLPRLLSLKDRYEMQGGEPTLMAEAFLGMIQGPLKNDGKEMAAWLQDERMGFRAPSFLGAALKDEAWRLQIHTAVEGLSRTSRSEWMNLREEWDVLGPHSHSLIDYVAKNVVLRSDKAQYQKQALEALARTTGDEARWRASQNLFEAWLDDRSVLKQWQNAEMNR